MNKIGKAIIWNTLGSTVYLGCLWLLNILVVRVGNYSEAGVLSLAISVANVVQSISLAGIRNFQVSDVEGKYTNFTYIVARYITSSLGFIGCMLFVLFNSYSRYQTACVMAMCIYRILDGLTDVYHGILQKNWRLDLVGKALILRGIGVVLSFTIILQATKSLFYAILGMTILSFLIFLFGEHHFAGKIDNVSRHFDWGSTTGLILHTIPLALYTTLLNGISVVTRYYIELIEGEEKLGYYSSIASPALIVQVAATYIFTPLIGKFAEYNKQKEEEKFIRLMWKCVLLIAAVFVTAILVCLFLGDFGLKLLFGETILSYSDLLMPIVLSTGLTAIVLFQSMLLVVLRDMVGVTVGNVIGFAANLVLAPMYLKTEGLQGANTALILSLTVDVVVLSIFTFIKIRRERGTEDGAKAG